VKRLVVALALVVSSLAGLQACSPSGGADAITTQESTKWTSQAPTKAMGLSIVDRMFTAPKNVAHGGLRHVVYELPSNEGPHRLEYLERVVADGQGHFALTPVRVDAPAMNATQLETFELIQKQRESFFFSYRDFGVRDRALFQANYRVTTVPTNEAFLGRECVELEIRRHDQPQTWYSVLVDSKSGLVLRSVERTTAGVVLSRTEFLEFTLTPDLEGVEWFSPRYAPTAVPLTAASSTTLGFTPAEPRLLPAGFQHLSSDVLSAEGDPWVRRVYGDGVESLFVLHKRRADHGLLQASSPHQSERMNAGSMPAPTAPTTVTIRLCQVGPWTMAEATRGLEQIFVVGKVAEAEVIRVLQSTL